MEQFVSGWKKSYYGKGDVTVYRLNRDGVTPPGQSPVFGANVKILIYGDAFWPTYTTGDNTGLIATDSMKNFIQRETMNFPGTDLEAYCHFLGSRFLDTYPRAEGAQVSAAEIPYAPIPGQTAAFQPAGPERLTVRCEIDRQGIVEMASGIAGFRMVRLGGSAFFGFVRDQYTTLPEITNRPLHMWLDLEWLYRSPQPGSTGVSVAAKAREIVHATFGAFESGSIQQIVYRIGAKMLAELDSISEIHLEANNRTWDTVVEQGDELGVYSDARPPYGCLGLRLRRQI
ncbi:MAG: urate oxidase [Acidobacteriota bacterium]|nr:urate oxidase [Acidobacteriota bacterium]